ncbi:hypothetical protein DFH08DRAFT_801604 [Mycena albidolilacea]|uniref:Uncharacterized protein n=1 Tax=Mycena albidolilacea TaxID=1033008 RepID=A0AAD7EZ02_9AGAR|nr:hypothetical protein DFH08DRAFT_801604 [Mycena albidolilacea]
MANAKSYNVFGANLRDWELEDALENAPLIAEVSWTRIAEEGDPDFRRLASNTLKKLEKNATPTFPSPIRVPESSHTLLFRSGCTIRELKCEVYDTGSALWRQLELFRELDTLDAFLEIRIADLFDALDAECDDDDTSPPILPKLQHIKITFEGGGARGNVINCARILDLVLRRRAHE